MTDAGGKEKGALTASARSAPIRPSYGTGTANNRLPDVEGLRAIAVVAVMFFHLGLRQFRSGFLGVDVFFVISGFVITLVLTNEPRIGLLEFWTRRAIRLLPAYFATIVATGLLCLAIQDPTALTDFGYSLFASVVGGANIFFWHSSSYFDPGNATRPLLHLWSLGVEFQFYLVWPFIAAPIFAARRAPWLMIVLVAASLSAVLLVLPRDPIAVFYLTPFRAFEFIAGAAALLVRRRALRIPNLLLQAAVLLALGAVLYGVTIAPTSTPLFSLVPVTGTAVVLALGGMPSFVTTVLGRREMVWLGGLSYSLYLAHWPILSIFAYFTQRDPTLSDAAWLLPAIVLTALALHYLVERPLRAERRPAAPKYIVGGAAISAAAALLFVLTSGVPWRATNYEAIEPGYLDCMYPSCVIPAGEAHSDVVVLGDSHAAHLGTGLRDLAARDHVSFSVFDFDGGCRFINAPSANHIEGYDCNARLQQALDFIASSGTRHVLWAHRWTNTDSQEAAVQMAALRTRPEMSQVEDYGIILNVPEFADGGTPASCMRPFWLPVSHSCSDAARSDAIQIHVEEVNQVLRTSLLLADFAFFDPFQVFCDQTTCATSREDHWLYADAHHLSRFGSIGLMRGLEPALLRWIADGSMHSDR